MEAISLFRFAADWLFELVRIGAWCWLLALLLALAGWIAWSVQHLLVRIRRAVGRRRGWPAVHRSAPEPQDDPALTMGLRR